MYIVNELNILEILKNSKIVIYGAGYVARKFYEVLVMQGLSKNLEEFVVSNKEEVPESINGIRVSFIKDFRSKKNHIICICVHESVKGDIEKILNERGITNYIWIQWRNLLDLLLGTPIKRGVTIPVDEIFRKYKSIYPIAARYLVIEQYFGKNNLGYNIYLKAQRIHCKEETANKRLNSFCQLIKNWEKYGYNSKYRILINENIELLDGLHRLTLAKYYNIDSVVCDIYRYSPYYTNWVGNNVIWTRTTLQENGFSEFELEMLENQYRKMSGES